MKKEITFTAVPLVDQTVFQGFLDEFEAQFNTHVNLEIIEWDQYRSHFVDIALQHRSGDVATAGTPITSDLIGMNSLRPFSSTEIATFGGASAFLPSRWQSGIRSGEPQVWAIPWVIDIRVFYYWRDLFAAAGVDESTAFATPQGFAEALRQLAQHGHATPWSGPFERYATLHTASSWIWASGGDLFSPGGKKVIFHEADALAALRAYLEAMVYSRGVQGPTSNNSLFLERKTAIMLGNSFAASRENPLELGCAPAFGCSYIGGSDLMIWSHTRQESAALELVRFLLRPDIQSRLAAAAGHLPTRNASLAELAARGNSIDQMLVNAAQTGHTFPCVPMVGLVEDRLSGTLFAIQQELLSNPSAEIETLLKRLVQLGNRTNLSLVR